MNYSLMYQELHSYLENMERAVVAFSGGVDSSLLAYAAHQAMGTRVLAVTVSTPYIPAWEIEEALSFVQKHSISHQMINLPIPEDIFHNPPDRCYLCKKNLFAALMKEAQKHGIETIIEGSNTDDLKDYRPGLKALQELGIVSPYLVQGISKNQIRELSRHLGLAVWNKPSNACLLSRLPYHTEITESELDRIVRAEGVLREMQLHGSRVRSHGDIARLEIPVEQFADVVAVDVRTRLVERLKSCGYLYVALDLEGYQTGSMNKKVTGE